jgi:indole-3-glycerol phosphate synthase
MRILSDLEIDKLVNTARDLKMSILFEVHSKEEVIRALKFNPNLIGINNRNLENFKTDINNSIEIKKIIPDDVLIISESGIKSPEDISFLGKENINNFLIGESLMKSNKISEDLNLLVNKGK